MYIHKYNKYYNKNKICEFNKNLDIDIYHFTKENLNNTTNIIYHATGKNISYKKFDLFVEDVLQEAIRYV
jgi:hypothetical protein